MPANRRWDLIRVLKGQPMLLQKSDFTQDLIFLSSDVAAESSPLAGLSISHGLLFPLPLE